MRIKVKLSSGDVFRFSATAGRWGCGQIVFSKILQFIVIFEPQFRDKDSIGNIVQAKPLLSGWTMDGRFFSGAWEVIGSTAPTRKIILPEYKVGISGQTWVTDFEGNPLRQASTEEERDLTFQKSTSPLVFEEAFKAYHGYLPWKDYHARLLVKHELR